MICYRLVSDYKPLGPIISELQALSGLASLVLLEGWASMSNLTKSEDSQPMSSYRLV